MSPVVNSTGLAYNHKMNNAISYLKTLSLMLRARKSGDEDLEERMLDRLDDAWMRLSRREAELIERVSKYVARDLLSWPSRCRQGLQSSRQDGPSAENCPGKRVSIALSQCGST
jgi:hypothetical protein